MALSRVLTVTATYPAVGVILGDMGKLVNFWGVCGQIIYTSLSPLLPPSLLTLNKDRSDRQATQPPIFDRSKRCCTLGMQDNRNREIPREGGSIMLRFQTPLTAAAREIVVYCLEVAADEIIELYEDHEAWATAYPLSSACLTRELARMVLLELLDKLDAPEWYVPTDYHWLLVYECLKEHMALFNDAPVPSVVARLRTLASDQDMTYLHLPRRSRGMAGVSLDFDEFIDVYFWDTDFLTDAGLYDNLTAEAKQHLGVSGEVFGVTHALAPHPDELILKRWQESGTDKTKSQNNPDEG